MHFYTRVVKLESFGRTIQSVLFKKKLLNFDDIIYARKELRWVLVIFVYGH